MTEVAKPVVLTAHDTRRVCVLACVDPRTVVAYLAGRSVRCTTAARIASALRALGLPDRSEAPKNMGNNKGDIES